MENRATTTRFESTYKYINFIKSNPVKSSSSPLRHDSLYEDLPPPETVRDNKQPSRASNRTRRSGEPSKISSQPISSRSASSTISSSSNPTSSIHALFEAIHHDDVDYLKAYLSRGFDPFVQDEFKWNVLMLAAASKSNTVLGYFLEHVEDKRRVTQLIDQSDAGGNNAESLAERFRNARGIELLNQFRINLDKSKIKQEQVIETVEREQNEVTNEKLKYWCEACGKEFNQTQQEHLSSILHQLNETERPLSETSGKYHLRADNKGYQLLVKSGWNETSGLGANEQGVKNPIKGKLKLNRKGLGVASDDTKFQSNALSSVRLMKNKKSESSGSGDGVRLREFKRSKEKSKIKERNLRRYFDS